MNNADSNINGTDAGSAVIAITQEQDQLKAVMLRRKHGAFELIRTASVDSAETNLQSFAAEFTGQTEDETIVVGYGSAGMVFYRINVPNAKKEELAALVRLQTEARLPLPIEQMEFAWRSGSSDTGQVAITIAAARKEQLQNFAAQAAGIRPEKIMLNCEGIVKAWKTIFSGDNRQGLVLDIGVHSTQVCMVEDGRLGNAASLDMGTKDFSAGQAETAERFAQDMRSILKLFGVDEPAGLPIFVLSDGQTVITEMVSYLNLAGFNTKATLPKVASLELKEKLSVSQIYEYRVAIGLAAMAFEPGENELNIFEGLYSPAKNKSRSRWYSPKLAGAIAAAMLVLIVIVCYLFDTASLKILEKNFTTSDGAMNCSMLLEQQKLIKAVALERPDLLRLLSEINSVENNQIKLDGFHFKKGQPVIITGQTKGDEQLYKFQKSLLTKKGISNVRIQSTKKDKSGRKLNFSVTFHYKNFTKKKVRG